MHFFSHTSLLILLLALGTLARDDVTYPLLSDAGDCLEYKGKKNVNVQDVTLHNRDDIDQPNMNWRPYAANGLKDKDGNPFYEGDSFSVELHSRNPIGSLMSHGGLATSSHSLLDIATFKWKGVDGGKDGQISVWIKAYTRCTLNLGKKYTYGKSYVTDIWITHH